MKNNLLIREYRDEGKNLVLNLFILNIPEYFAAEEEKELIYYFRK